MKKKSLEVTYKKQFKSNLWASENDMYTLQAAFFEIDSTTRVNIDVC